MSTTITQHPIIDTPKWRQASPTITATVAGSCVCGDLRGTEDRHPLLYYLASATLFYAYNIKNDEWIALASPALAGTFGAGTDMIFIPHKGPSGTFTVPSTTGMTLSTLINSGNVGVNQLANRGDGQGFKIRIMDNAAGGTGKIYERYIIGNTSGTTPIITVDQAFDSQPITGGTYEILSGQIYMLNSGLQAAGSFRAYDIATNTFASLAYANLPATITTDSHMVNFSESYNPQAYVPGSGMIAGVTNVDTAYPKTGITAAASSGVSITGPAASGDFNLLANEYRNFQIRIVQDATTPTSVGQRRNITSHTAGPSVVYTVPTWTVTPSASAVYVIEGNGNNILLSTTASANMFNYSISGNAWDVSTTWAARSTAIGAGVCGDFPFGMARDPTGKVRHSYLFIPRGGASSAIDLLDIAGAATGAWTNTIVYGNLNTLFTTGTTSCYNPMTQGGKYLYINVNGTQRNVRFDMINRILEPYGYIDFPQGVAACGRRVAISGYFDGATILPFLTLQGMTLAQMFQNVIFR